LCSEIAHVTSALLALLVRCRVTQETRICDGQKLMKRQRVTKESKYCNVTFFQNHGNDSASFLIEFKFIEKYF
jgi:hypothetical protein